MSYFYLNFDKEKIFNKLNYIIPHWIMLLGNSNNDIHWLRNVIYQRLKTWAIKKYKGSHKKIYDEHLSKFKLFYNYKTLPFNIPLSNNFPVFHNIKKNQSQIENYLNSLDIKSGIYIFYLTDRPLHFYLGQSIDFKKIFQAHINQSFNNLSNTKFYNFVNKYQWDKFSFMVIETCSPEFLDQQEIYWLDIIFNSSNSLNYSILKKNTLNSDWKRSKHTES